MKSFSLKQSPLPFLRAAAKAAAHDSCYLAKIEHEHSFSHSSTVTLTVTFDSAYLYKSNADGYTEVEPTPPKQTLATIPSATPDPSEEDYLLRAFFTGDSVVVTEIDRTSDEYVGLVASLVSGWGPYYFPVGTNLAALSTFFSNFEWWYRGQLQKVADSELELLFSKVSSNLRRSLIFEEARRRKNNKCE